MYLNIAAYTECTEVEGPGKRFVLWVQGCLKRCPGCCNPHMLALEPRWTVKCSEIIRLIQQAKENHSIEGVTFLGGEPMLQAKGLAQVAKTAHAQDLSIMIFTGYTLSELKRLNLNNAKELLGLTDVLVDGPYVESLREMRRNWAGSTNQRFHFLTKRYPHKIIYDSSFRHGVEFRIDDNGLEINGWPCSHNLSRRSCNV